MKAQIEVIDQLLSKIEVKGDSVIMLAEARKELKALYDQVKEEGDG